MVRCPCCVPLTTSVAATTADSLIVFHWPDGRELFVVSAHQKADHVRHTNEIRILIQWQRYQVNPSIDHSSILFFVGIDADEGVRRRQRKKKKR